MQVGILSMQRIVNYGSFLQAFALKQTLRQMGAEAGFIDVRPGRLVFSSGKTDKKNPFFLLSKIDRNLWKRINNRKLTKRRHTEFTQKWQEELGVNSPINEKDCDLVIIGSDEVFHVNHHTRWGFSTQLFGDVLNDNVISYAGSFANTNYEDLCRLQIKEEVCSSLRKMKTISVRDEESALCVERLLGVRPYVHLDPVLIYDFEKEPPKEIPFEKYVLIYSYSGRINNPDEIRAIKRFAKERGLKTIAFGLFQSWCDKNVLVDPFTMLACFDHADYVVTDTFHGTVFSIKRNKKFATLIRDSNRTKLADLLRRFELESRQVVDTSKLSETLERDIDYVKINEKIRVESERSRDYLHKALEDAQNDRR